MTANALKGDREKCLAAGMDDYVPKPVRVEDLDRVLHQTIGSSPGSQEEASVTEATRPHVARGRGGRAVPRRPRARGEDRPDAIDRRRLAVLRAIAPKDKGRFVAELIDKFMEEAPRHLDRLRRAAREGDAAGCERAAHGLRGGAGSLGAAALAGLCAEIEDTARAGSPAEAIGRLADLEREFLRVRRALETERSRSPKKRRTA